MSPLSLKSYSYAPQNQGPKVQKFMEKSIPCKFSWLTAGSQAAPH